LSWDSGGRPLRRVRILRPLRGCGRWPGEGLEDVRGCPGPPDQPRLYQR
jgi:hypothetical protein